MSNQYTQKFFEAVSVRGKLVLRHAGYEYRFDVFRNIYMYCNNYILGCLWESRS